MSVFKRLVVALTLVAFATSKDDAPAPGASSVDPYSIAPVPGDLVTNGGFENGATGWTFSADTFLGPTTDTANAFSGNAYARFGVLGHAGTATKSITTVASTTYIINFHVACLSSTPPNNFAFKLNGAQLYSVADDVAHDYVLHTYAFTTPASGSTSTSNVLEFDGQHDDSYFRLDDVSVVVLPVPCNTNFYAFDPATGDIKAETGKIYPGPPQPDTTFPVITDAGQLLFNYKSDALSATLPRIITLGLAPLTSATGFDGTQTICQWQRTQGASCPSYTDIGFTFSLDVAYTIQDDFETLFVKGCVTRTTASDLSTVTYAGDAFTLYMDPYNLGNRWSELQPISFSMTLPYTSQASTTAVVDVVSDVVAVEYQPIQVINTGTSTNPIVQFTTIARTLYPFAAFGAGTTYTPSSGSQTPATDPATNQNCVLYRPTGEVASTTTFCDANPGLCTVECTRVIPITPPACDLSGYVWTFTYEEFQDFAPPGTATTHVTDPAWVSFTEQINFDTNPQWNVCPDAASTDLSRFISAAAVHGHFDSTTGSPVPDAAAPASINTPLTFGFKIAIGPPSSPGNPTYTPSSAKIYKATLTEMVVTRPDSTPFYLVGSSVGPTVGGPGADQNRADGLSFNPNPSGSVYGMYIAPVVVYTDPKFATVTVTFTPKLGLSSGPNMLYYTDSSDYPGGVTLTVTFAGVISLFKDGSTPSKRDVFFRRQLALSPNGTYADPNQIENSHGTQNSTTITIQVPELVKAINAATIAGSVVGGLVGLALLGTAVFFYRKNKKASKFLIPTEKLESGDY